MVNARAELLMIGVVLVIAVVTTGALVQRLRGEQVQAGSAFTKRVGGLLGRWGEALEVVRACPWLIAVPLLIGGIETTAQWVLLRHVWGGHPGATHRTGSFGGLFRGFHHFRLDSALHLSLMAGSIHLTTTWTSILVLIVAGGVLLRRRTSASTWTVWTALVMGSGVRIWQAIARVTARGNLPGAQALGVVTLLTDVGLVTLTGSVILLALRRSVRQERVTLSALSDEVIRFWSEWFLLALLIGLPRILFVLIATYATASSGGAAESWLRPVVQSAWVRSGVLWLGVVLALGFRFAPYALAEGARSAEEGARESFRLWRERGREVVGVLAPLWCLGLLCYICLSPLGGGASLPLSSFVGLMSQVLRWLGISAMQAFLLFAEIVCLQWYRSVVADAGSQQDYAAGPPAQEAAVSGPLA